MHKHINDTYISILINYIHNINIYITYSAHKRKDLVPSTIFTSTLSPNTKYIVHR